MSFSSEIKSAILAKPGKLRCCRRAFADGLLASALSDRQTLTFLVAEETVADGIASAVREAYPGKGAPAVSKTDSFLFLVSVGSEAALRYVGSIGAPGVQPFTPKCRDCRAAFLRGVFVGCGRVSDPSRFYHLEFSCAGRAERLRTVFDAFGIGFRLTRRNNEELLYSKNSTQIQDFFGLLGENDAYFSLMNARIEREIRNGANRVANCEANNITKAVNAAAEQLKAIEYLANANLLGSLPSELAETAKLRLANRDLSLSQLAAMAVPPITKPGLNHRLRRLVAIADEHSKRTTPEERK